MKLKTINLKNLSSTAFSYWLKYYKLFFILLFIIALGVGLFYWYDTFYRFHWSDEKKEQYSLTQNRNTNLKAEEFNKALEAVEKRKQNFDKSFEKMKDIFKSE